MVLHGAGRYDPDRPDPSQRQQADRGDRQKPEHHADARQHRQFPEMSGEGAWPLICIGLAPNNEKPSLLESSRHRPLR